MKLTEMKVNEFISVLASDAPAPGGGSASALAGAMGVGLSKMVAALTLGKPKYAEYEEKVQQIFDRADKLTKELVNGIDRATEAFDGYPLFLQCQNPPTRKKLHARKRCRKPSRKLLWFHTPLWSCVWNRSL